MSSSSLSSPEPYANKDHKVNESLSDAKYCAWQFHTIQCTDRGERKYDELESVFYPEKTTKFQDL
jgi:hypothetical protein